MEFSTHTHFFLPPLLGGDDPNSVRIELDIFFGTGVNLPPRKRDKEENMLDNRSLHSKESNHQSNM